MHPVHMRHGRYYWAVKCQNPECRQTLPLIEVPARPTSEEDLRLRESLKGLRVRCPACTQETVAQPQIFLEAR